MRKVFAIASTCCVLALALGLVGCGGSSGGPSSSGETSSGSAARAEAQAALDEGLGYWFGTGKNGYDKEKARAAFQQAADKGNAEGWYWLGRLRQHDVQADRWPQVVELYQKAADNGCAKGWCGLGRLYETGYGLEADVAKAAELYQRAIDVGELYGNVCLGYLYATGSGVEKSYETAADWCNKSLAAACPGDDGIVEYANNMLAQIAESSQREAQA